MGIGRPYFVTGEFQVPWDQTTEWPQHTQQKPGCSLFPQRWEQ